MVLRAGRILLIAWQAWCLNVFLPAHTRGAMTVGTPTARASCCAGSCGSDRREQGKPTPEERSRCSVCYFATGLSTPPIVDLRLASLGLVDLLDPPAPATVVSRDFPLPYYACGPPIVVA